MSVSSPLLPSRHPERLVGSAPHFAVKANVAVRGEQIALGPESFIGTAAEDAPIVTLLESRGFSLVGRTQLTPLALEGSGVGLPLVNPIDAAQIVFGSSTGSAIAVASGDCQLAVGTDFGGSSRLPAVQCGVHSLKLVSGYLPIGESFVYGGGLDAASLLFKDFQFLRQALDIPGGVEREIEVGDERVKIAQLAPTWFMDAATSAKWKQLLAEMHESPQTDIDILMEELADIRVPLSLHAIAGRLEALIEVLSGALLDKATEHVQAGRSLSNDTLTESQDRQRELKSRTREILQDGVLLMPAVAGIPPRRKEVQEWELSSAYFRFSHLANICDCFSLYCSLESGFGVQLLSDKRHLPDLIRLGESLTKSR